MVAGPLPRNVHGLGALDRPYHVLPVEHAIRPVDHLADVVEPGLVREHLPQRDVLLACLRELGPVLGDAVLVVEQATVDLGPDTDGLADRRSGLAGPLERRAVDRVDLLQIRDPFAGPFGPLSGASFYAAAWPPAFCPVDSTELTQRSRQLHYPAPLVAVSAACGRA